MPPPGHPICEAFSLAASIARYRAFETLLAEAQAEVGLVPKDATVGESVVSPEATAAPFGVAQA